jgi:hypothetical protein
MMEELASSSDEISRYTWNIVLVQRRCAPLRVLLTGGVSIRLRTRGGEGFWIKIRDWDGGMSKRRQTKGD